METGLTTVEIMLGVLTLAVMVVLGLVVYFVARNKDNSELAKDVGSVKKHCESIDGNLTEVRTDVRNDIREVRADVKEVRITVDAKTDALRAESVSAHQQIGTNIETLRSETKRDMGKSEERLSKNAEEVEGRLSKNAEEVEGRLSKNIEEVEGRLLKNIGEVEGRLLKNIGEVEGRLSNSIEEVKTLLLKSMNSKGDSDKTD